MKMKISLFLIMLTSTVSVFASDFNDGNIDIGVIINNSRKIAKQEIKTRGSEPNSFVVCRYLGATMAGAVAGVGYSKGVDSLPKNILEPQNPWVMGLAGAIGAACLYSHVRQQAKQLKIDQRALELLSAENFRLKQKNTELEKKLQTHRKTSEEQEGNCTIQ